MSISKYFTARPYRRAFHRWRFDAEAFAKREDAKLAAWGLDPVSGRRRLDEALAALERPAYRPEKDSVHWLLFACLSEITRPAAILELGTDRGEFTVLLSRLFSGARITTVDLPEDDPLSRSFGRGGGGAGRPEDVGARDALRAAANVTAIERNSLFLLDSVAGPFDLVWVDAGHLFPEVAWDLANAWHLCREGGFILSDDVITPADARHHRSGRVNSDAYTALRYLEARVPGDATLFSKRRGVRYVTEPRLRKYVSLMQRRSAG